MPHVPRLSRAPMAEPSRSASQQQPVPELDDDVAHDAVTLAPPAPFFDEPTSGDWPKASTTTQDGHFRAALDAGARTTASLNDVARVAAELSRGLSGAKQANEQLLQELATLRAMLGSASEQELELRHRLGALTQELFEARTRAAREGEALAAQHDDFIAGLIEEHDESLSQALSERDEARSRAEKHERERDALRAEASQLRVRLSQPPAPSSQVPPARPPSFRSQPALRLDEGELDFTLHARSPEPPSVVPRATARPSADTATPGLPTVEEFPRESTRPGVGGPKPAARTSEGSQTGVVSAASLPPPERGLYPPLKQKPDPTTRPLVDYSLGRESLPGEKLEGVRLSSKPPRK